MDDLIYRWAAIDALIAQANADGAYGYISARDAEIILDSLPAAQPEIVRCIDCRWGREACGNIECFADVNVPTEYHSYDWFCPNGERRE